MYLAKVVLISKLQIYELSLGLHVVVILPIFWCVNPAENKFMI
jgi:hypothetical protein